MNKKYRRLMIVLSVVVGALFAVGFVGVFYPPLLFDMQLLPLIQRLSADFSFAALGLLFLLLLFTFLFGRFYCAALCPLGLFQELLFSLFARGRKTKPGRPRPYKYFMAAVFFRCAGRRHGVFVPFARPLYFVRLSGVRRLVFDCFAGTACRFGVV